MMKVTLFVCACLVISSQAVDVGRMFEEFESTFEKMYKNAGEREYRLEVFTENLNTMSALNSENSNSTAVFGFTPFADLTVEEFRATVLMPSFSSSEDPCVAPAAAALPTDNLPASVDWRDSGMVTDIKDQGGCGSCWAFSATQNIEGLYAKAGNDLTMLSYEQILECDPHDGACYGGWPSCAFKYVKEQGGISKQDDYRNGEYLADGHTICLKNQTFNMSCIDPPCTNYCDVDASCSLTSGGDDQITVTAKISGYESVSEDETQIAAYLAANGPLSIALNAGSFGFQMYKGGVMDPKRCNPASLDHAVLLVGYGTDTGVDYWTVKNSWGTKWGEDGYFRIARGKGTCGLNTAVTSALM